MVRPKISISGAKQDKLQYVVANFAIVNPKDKTVLLLQRSKSEKVHPGKWGFTGGKLEHSNIADMIEEEGVESLKGVSNVLGKLAKREAAEEAGLQVSSQGAQIIVDKVFIRPDGIPVFMVTLAAKYEGGEVKLEEGVIDHVWVKEQDLDKYDCIPGIQDEARQALDQIAG
jgi:8-oxo-dGTP pyrophosphatase MutT (NUDIX family)